MIGDDKVTLILGDDIFYGPNLSRTLVQQASDIDGRVLFGDEVKDPERHGLVELDADGELVAGW